MKSSLILLKASKKLGLLDFPQNLSRAYTFYCSDSTIVLTCLKSWMYRCRFVGNFLWFFILNEIVRNFLLICVAGADNLHYHRRYLLRPCVSSALNQLMCARVGQLRLRRPLKCGQEGCFDSTSLAGFLLCFINIAVKNLLKQLIFFLLSNHKLEQSEAHNHLKKSEIREMFLLES